MSTPISVDIRRAESAELPVLLGVQHRAFLRVAAQYGLDPSDLSPIRETLDDLLALPSETVFMVAVVEGRIVGTVRAIPGPECIDIGRLAVEDGFEGQGIGRALMEFVHGHFGDDACYRLFTGERAERPLRLYRSLGYVHAGQETSPSGIPLVYLERHGGRT